MGYMGMDNILASDNAADLLWKVGRATAQTLRVRLKERDDTSFNTDGFDDVGMFFRDVIVPAAKETDVFLSNEDLQDVAAKVLKGLEKKIKKAQKEKKGWDPDNLRDHLGWWRGMVKSLKWFIEEG